MWLHWMRAATHCMPLHILHAAAAKTHLAVIGQRLRNRQRGGAREHAHLQHRLGARQPAQGGYEAALQRAGAALRLLQELCLALQRCQVVRRRWVTNVKLRVRGLYTAATYDMRTVAACSGNVLQCISQSSGTPACGRLPNRAIAMH
jgi:hypothetical protein